MKLAPLDWQIRVNAALILMIIELASIVALSHAPRDDSYYLICGAFNLAIVLILPSVSNNTLIIDLRLMNMVALCLQAYGFISYWSEWPVQIYNHAIHALNLMQILRLLIVRKTDAGFLRLDENYQRDTVVRNINIGWRRFAAGFQGKKEEA